MNKDSKKTTLKIIGIFVVITGLLFFLDYQSNNSENSNTLLGSAIRGIFRPSTISQDILESAGMGDKELITQGSNKSFFPEYLRLPSRTNAEHFTLSDSSIEITEVASNDPEGLISHLLSQENESYRFNQINRRTFYLNQVPADSKTHNFLAIAIGDVIYGWKYVAKKDHQNVLKIIDALQENQ